MSPQPPLLVSEGVLQEKHTAGPCLKSLAPLRSERTYCKEVHGIPLFLPVPRAEHPESRLEQVDLPTSNSRKTHHWAGPAPKAISSEEWGGSILADGSLLTLARAPGE